VRPDEWFFKAHFFQDPVQPGSLGLEAMLQLLQFYMLHAGLGDRCRNPRFEPIAIGRSMTWKYRGQVIPSNRVIAVTMEITEVGTEAGCPFAVADASLWVDGKRIYQATQMAMRIVEAGDPPAARPRSLERRTPAEFLPEVRAFWADWFGAPAPVVDDVYRGLIDRFIAHVAIEDPDAVRAACRRGVVFLGNHQTAVESLLFAVITSALAGRPVVTLAKIENREHWLERLMQHTFAHPGVRGAQMTRFFDRSDRASLRPILRELAGAVAEGGSAMVHVEGTRARSCRTPVRTMSGTLLDMVLAARCAIIPVRFAGGLPIEPATERLDFPLAMGRQDIYLGRPISVEELESRNYRDRTLSVLAAINDLGPANQVEEPLGAAPAFEAEVEAWRAQTGASLFHAVLYRVLEQLPDPSPATADLVRGARAGALRLPASPDGQWLAELARRLFGDTGPAVIVDGA